MGMKEKKTRRRAPPPAAARHHKYWPWICSDVEDRLSYFHHCSFFVVIGHGLWHLSYRLCVFNFSHHSSFENDTRPLVIEVVLSSTVLLLSLVAMGLSERALRIPGNSIVWWQNAKNLDLSIKLHFGRS